MFPIDQRALSDFAPGLLQNGSELQRVTSIRTGKHVQSLVPHRRGPSGTNRSEPPFSPMYTRQGAATGPPRNPA